MTILEAARAATAAGIVALPTRGRTKAPGVDWKRYQTERPSTEELRRWFAESEAPGVGVLCGSISGNLELLEFEDSISVLEFKAILDELGRSDLWRTIEAGYAERSPSGGIHWLYRLEERPAGNTKLASKPCPEDCDKHETGKPHVLIETRGEGGFVVVAPTSVRDDQPPGLDYTLYGGGFDQIATISAEDHTLLFEVGRSLDQMPVPEVRPPNSQEFVAFDGRERPGDRFNKDAPWGEILRGWKPMYTRNGLTAWLRPGKKGRGVSATTGIRERGDNMLRVFTTSTEFEARIYSPFAAFAISQHGGDFSAAARELARDPRYRSVHDAPEEAIPSNLIVTPVGTADADTGEIIDEPEVDEPEEEGQPTEPYCFEPIFPPGHFVSDYIEYAASRTDAVHEFHEALALGLLACATSGVKLHYGPWGEEGLGTNLYLLLVGESSRARKTTALKLAKAVLRKVLANAEISQRFTPESFQEQLSKRSHEPSVWISDEYASQIGEVMRRPHLEGLQGLMLRVYDGENTRYERASKRVRGGGLESDYMLIEEPHFNVWGACTGTIYGMLKTDDLESGLLQRHAYVIPLGTPERKKASAVTPEMERQARNVVVRLGDIRQQVAGTELTPISGIEARLTPEAEEILDAGEIWIEDQGETVLGRLPAMGYKLAMLIALGRGGEVVDRGEFWVTAEDAQLAIKVVQRWAHYAMYFASKLGDSEFERTVDRAVAYVKRSRSVTRRDVSRVIKLKKREMDELQDTLEDRGLIRIEVSRPKVGRPSETWFWHGS